MKYDFLLKKNMFLNFKLDYFEDVKNHAKLYKQKVFSFFYIKKK